MKRHVDKKNQKSYKPDEIMRVGKGVDRNFIDTAMGRLSLRCLYGNATVCYGAVSPISIGGISTRFRP
jgi:hypothetical protein